MGNKLIGDSIDDSPSSEKSLLEHQSEEDNLDSFSLEQRIGYSPSNMSNNIVSTPILITDNLNLTATATTRGWSGTGTDFDPIIIENYNITSNNDPFLFQMHNVSLYFILRNCYFDADAYENNTLFYNVTNGLIIGNTIINTSVGFYGLFMDSPTIDNTIKYNTFENLGTNVYSLNATFNNFLYNYYSNVADWTDDNPTKDGICDNSYLMIDPFNGTDDHPRVYKQFWNHEIINTTNLQNFANQEGFLGNGSQVNPFIISDLNITVMGNVHTLIALPFNDYYVRFDNCYLQGNNISTIGIALGTNTLSASNVTINQTTICNLGSAIVISNTASSNNNITFSEVYNCTKAIEFFRGNYNYFSFNHFYDINEGVTIIQNPPSPSYNIFLNNTIEDVKNGYGFNLTGGNYNQFINNTIANTTHFGVYTTASAQNTWFEKNVFYNCSNIAASAFGGDVINVTLLENIFLNNSGLEPIRILSGNANIIGNHINNSNSNGIYIGTGACNISKNVFYNNNDGILLSAAADRTRIWDNIITYSRNVGITIMPAADYVVVENNTVFESTNQGISIWANHTWLTRNTIYSNNFGVSISSGKNNTIFLNDLYNNTFSQGQDTSPNANENSFSYLFLGNYYSSDYTGADLNGDKVGETTYTIAGSPGNIDKWPLTVSHHYFQNTTFINGSWVGSGGLEVRSNEYITIEGDFDLNGGTDLRLNNVTIRFVCSSNGSNFLRIFSGHSFSAYNSIITSANVSNRFYLYAISGSALYLEDTWISFAGHSDTNRGVQIDIDDVTLLRSNFTNNYIGIFTASCSNLNVQHCVFNNSIKEGIYLFDTQNIIVNRTIFDRNKGNYIEYFNGNLNCTFLNNTIINSKSALYALHIVANSSIIINNFFRQNLGLYTLYIDTSGVGTNITGNDFYNNTGTAIYIKSNNCSVFRNIIQNSSQNGIYIEGNNTIIEDCTINNSQVHGIFLLNCYNVSIVQTNTSNNIGYGIFCQQSTLITVDYLMSSFNDRGIMIQDSSNCTVANAAIWNNTDRNIACYYTGSSPTQYITIINTSVYNCTGHGIYFQYVNESLIKNCTIYSNLNGIFIEGLPATDYNNDIIGNNISRNLDCGVIINTANSNNLLLNNFSSNGVVSGIDRGVWIYNGAANNLVFNNSFLSGTAQDDELTGNNFWNNTAHGNYWYNYNAFDTDSNGIGDTPYLILGSANAVDNFPLGIFQSFNIIIIDPTNSTFTSIPITINVSASQYVDSCWYQIYQGGMWININISLTYSNFFWTGFSSLGSGSYRIRAFINDTLGNENIAIPVYFNISYSFLSITLLNPTNGSILQSTVQIDVDVLGSNGSYTYNWDAGTTVTNTTVSVVVLISLPTSEGFHTLEVYARNNVFNWSKAYYEFWVDDTEPTIDYFVSDVVNAGNSTYVPFAINDTNQDNYWYTIDGGPPIFPNKSGLIAPSTIGNYQIVVYANDSAGNQRNITFTLYVQQAITITLNYPTGGELISSWCNISWSCTEELDYRIYFSPNNGSSWTVLVDSVQNTSYLWDTTQVNDGTNYLVRIASITTGQPGAVLSNDTFTIRNNIQQLVPPGSYTYNFQDVSIEITTSEPTNITIERLSTLPSGIELNETYSGFGLYIDITLSNPSALVYMNISFSYADLENDPDFDLDELEVYFFNESSNQWERADDLFYDTENKLIIGYFDHTTVIGVLGRSQSFTPPAGLEILLIILFVSIVFGGAVVGLYKMRNRRKPQAPKLSTEEKLKVAFKAQKEKKSKEGHLDLSALEFDLSDEKNDDM